MGLLVALRACVASFPPRGPLPATPPSFRKKIGRFLGAQGLGNIGGIGLGLRWCRQFKVWGLGCIWLWGV